MRRFLVSFLVLNIYTHFSAWSQTEQLHLRVSGKTEQQTQIIDSISYAKVFKDFQSTQQALDSLKHKLTGLGYLDIKEIIPLKKVDSVFISKLDLGTYYSYLNLKIPNNSSQNYLDKLGIPIKRDSIRIRTAFAKALLEQLSALASEEGKPFTIFQIQQLQKEKNYELTGILEIVKDTTRYIDHIVVQDYEKIPPGFLKYYAGFKKGQTFNQNELLQKSDALAKLPFLDIKKNPEVLFSKDSTTVYLYISKKNNNRFDGFIGFTTDEETNRLQLNGYLDLLLVNNLNYGEQLKINYKSDGEDQQQLRIKATLPYLFKTSLGAELSLALFRRDSSFSETTQTFALFYQWKERTKIRLGYKRKQSENLEELISNTNLQDFTQDKFLGSFHYTVLQNNPLFPERTLFSLAAEVGTRETTANQESQLGFESTTSHIFKLNSRNHIFLNNTTQVLFSDNYLMNELYRFGGITSIRGFAENSIFAHLQSTLNTEYRYVLSPSLYVHSIIDAGYFENETINQKSRLFGIGLGAGLITKAGVFKINIANGRNEDQEFQLSNTRVHLRLEARF